MGIFWFIASFSSYSVWTIQGMTVGRMSAGFYCRQLKPQQQSLLMESDISKSRFRLSCINYMLEGVVVFFLGVYTCSAFFRARVPHTPFQWKCVFGSGSDQEVGNTYTATKIPWPPLLLRFLLLCAPLFCKKKITFIFFRIHILYLSTFWIINV